MKPNIVFLDEYTLGGARPDPPARAGSVHGLQHDRAGRGRGSLPRCRNRHHQQSRDAPPDARRTPRLRLICIAATGMNNIDLDAAAELGIAVRNAAGYSTHSVAETTLGAAIALRRHIVYYDRYVKSGAYSAAGSSSTSPNPRTSSTARSGASWGSAPSGTKWRGSPRPSAARYATPRPRAPCAKSPTPPCRFPNCWAGRTRSRCTRR